MSQNHYYEASGVLLKQLRERQKQTDAAIKEMFDFAKRFGTNKIRCSMSYGVRWSLDFEDESKVDKKLWKRDDSGGWRPKESTPEGKKLAAEKKAIAERCPSGSELGRIIGLEELKGLRWRTPGMVTVGRRVFLTVPPDYRPPKSLADQLKRISDIEFEKLTAEKKKKRKAKTAAA